MKLITSVEILRRYIPNVMQTIKGEVPLIEKLASFIDSAEEWVAQTFTSEHIFESISGGDDADVLKTYTIRVVVNEAFRNAIPSLDHILTPNGFGIVSNSNVAPASRDRVSRLADSLEAQRDSAIRLLISALSDMEEWHGTEQCSYFASTMFHNLDLCDHLGISQHLWQKYQELRSVLIDMEGHIASDFLGTEQLCAFRLASMTRYSTLLSSSMIRSLRAYEVQQLRNMLSEPSNVVSCSAPTALIDIVNVIRMHPEEFPEWHNSTIKDKFSPVLFKNKKEDKAFWF